MWPEDVWSLHRHDVEDRRAHDLDDFTPAEIKSVGAAQDADQTRSQCPMCPPDGGISQLERALVRFARNDLHGERVDVTLEIPRRFPDRFPAREYIRPREAVQVGFRDCTCVAGTCAPSDSSR